MTPWAPGRANIFIIIIILGFIAEGKIISTSKSEVEKTKKIQMLKRRMMTSKSLTMTLRARRPVRMRKIPRKASRVSNLRRREVPGKVKIKRENEERGKLTKELSTLLF